LPRIQTATAGGRANHGSSSGQQGGAYTTSKARSAGGREQTHRGRRMRLIRFRASMRGFLAGRIQRLVRRLNVVHISGQNVRSRHACHGCAGPFGVTRDGADPQQNLPPPAAATWIVISTLASPRFVVRPPSSAATAWHRAQARLSPPRISRVLLWEAVGKSVREMKRLEAITGKAEGAQPRIGDSAKAGGHESGLDPPLATVGMRKRFTT